MMEFVSWDDDIPFPTEWKIIIQSCSKPPISLGGYSHPSNRSEHLTSQRNSIAFANHRHRPGKEVTTGLGESSGCGWGDVFNGFNHGFNNGFNHGFNHGFNPCLRIFDGFNHVLTMF